MSKHSRHAVVRAIDVGYGNTKFTTDEEGSCMLFRSLATPAEPDHPDAEIVAKRDVIRVLVDDQEFEVGPHTVYSDCTPELHDDYIDTPQHQALFRGALAMMKVKEIDVLVTGLPVHLHAARASALQKQLRGRHEVQKGVTVTVHDVMVVPQPLGGFVAHSFESNYLSRTQERANLLVDPGFYTFDWMVANGLLPDKSRSHSVSIGVSAYLSHIERAFCKAHAVGDSRLLREIDAGLRTGEFRRFGQPVDLTPFKAAAQYVLDRAVKEMRNTVGAGDSIEEIFIVGGGAAYFEESIRRYYPKHPVTVVKDPVFANVRGFHLIGRTRIERRAA